jgi:polyphenol oxidase
VTAPGPDEDTHELISIPMRSDVEAWFTGRRMVGVTDANLSHRRPHHPVMLAAARTAVAESTGTDVSTWHLMRQVHGADLAEVGPATPLGAEHQDVDILVTTLSERPLVVLVADCLPILLAGPTAVAAAHAGWRGLVADVPGRAVRALADLGDSPDTLSLAIGPAIGPCCYAVGDEVVAALRAAAPEARDRILATTTDGRQSVDLFAVACARLAALGVTVSQDRPPCTRCGPGSWFSHRADAASGRQAGIIVRRAAVGPSGGEQP